uniref:Tubby C-terminal domain-containing protein n=1 Tax=Chlamydomonas euryale TaxID=1486919 RepID=A0A7R9V1Y3_9CHLO|mmetsp:Transcript_14914/g.43820  ORF Transcript_14914/g.43820 Transcript_14914/m.43820 type:complete len:267 (+) Transcript_14914:847-1647(+)
MMASGVESRVEALRRSGPEEDFIRCYMVRKKGLFGGASSFEVYLESGNHFLLAARRRKKTKSASYVISHDVEALTRGSDACVAKLKASSVSGYQYQLWGRDDDVDGAKKGFGRQDMVIDYAMLENGTKGGPRGMQIILPVPESGWQPAAPDGDDSLSALVEAARLKSVPPRLEANIMCLMSKQPRYDADAGSYVLDFQGRVTEASVKNFQLVAWDHNADTTGEQPLVLFGKRGDNLFALDFRYPMSVETAFAVAISSVDSKLCFAV